MNRRDEVRALALAALAEVESNIDKFIDRTDLSEGPDGTEALTAAFALVLSAVVTTGFVNGAGRFAALALPITSIDAKDSPRKMMSVAHPIGSAPFLLAAAADSSLDDLIQNGPQPSQAVAVSLSVARSAVLVLGSATMPFHESCSQELLSREREYLRKHFDLAPMDLTGAGR